MTARAPHTRTAAAHTWHTHPRTRTAIAPIFDQRDVARFTQIVAGMQTTACSHVLQWEMYGPGTALAFCADADAQGYRVVLERDRSPLLTGVAADAAALFRISSELRAQLEHLGYDVKPRAGRASHLAGGPCWGPAAPLHPSLIETLHCE